MNRIELIELTQQHHPHMGEVEILKLINRAMDDFTSETEILKQYKDIGDTVAGQRYYSSLSAISGGLPYDYGATVAGTVKITVSEHGLTTGDEIVLTSQPDGDLDGTYAITVIDNNNIYFYKSWVAETSVTIYKAISTDILKVLNVWIDDVLIPRIVNKDSAMLIDDDEHHAYDNALGTPSSTSNERYWYPIDDNGIRLGLVEKSTNTITRDDKTSNFQSISETGLQIRLHCISRGTHLTAGSSSGNTYTPEIPSMFHEALVYKAIASGYKDMRNQKLDVAQYFDNEYQLAIKKAKKKARSGSITTGFIAPQSY